jgi:hypothetical protein
VLTDCCVGPSVRSDRSEDGVSLAVILGDLNQMEQKIRERRHRSAAPVVRVADPLWILI